MHYNPPQSCAMVNLQRQVNGPYQRFSYLKYHIQDSKDILVPAYTVCYSLLLCSHIHTSVVLVHKKLFSNSYSYLNDERIRISVFIVYTHFLNVSYSYSFCLEMQLSLVTVTVKVIVLVTVMMCVLNVHSTIIMSYIHSSQCF